MKTREELVRAVDTARAARAAAWAANAAANAAWDGRAAWAANATGDASDASAAANAEIKKLLLKYIYSIVHAPSDREGLLGVHIR